VVEMVDLLVWELIAYRLEIQNVVSLFKTSRSLWPLSKRQNLWSYLMRRDFPEHYKQALPNELQTWYQDLHQHGAYWCLTKKLPLYPSIPLCAVLDVGYTIPHTIFFGKYNVVTYRKREESTSGRYKFLRYPFQIFVDIVSEDSLNGYERGAVNEISLRKISSFARKGTNFLFMRREEKTHIARCGPLKKLTISLWSDTIAWIHEHFLATEIHYKLFEVYFTGMLKPGVTLSDPYDEETSPGQFKELETTTRLYNLYMNAGNPAIPKRVCLTVAQGGEYFFTAANGKSIPGWSY